MTEPLPVSTPAPATAEPPAPRTGQLRRGSIGVPGMVFMVVAATAPLTAMASNLSLSLGLGSGVGTLGWLVAVGALLAVFTSGYVALGRKVVSAGAYHAYISYGLGPAAGAAAALVAAIAYNAACAAMVVATGFFTALTLSSYVGLDAHWAWYAAAALVVVALLGHFGVGIAARLTALVSVMQFVLLAVLAGAIMLANPSGFTLDGFRPAAMLEGNFALTLVFCLLSFASYEAAATYGEECKAPGRSVRRATYAALGILLVVFLVATWSLTAAYDDVVAAAATDPGSLLSGAANQYLGRHAGAVITAIVAFSFLAAAVAFHNMAARYQFALGRARLLPGRLAQVHPRFGTPHVAAAVQIAINIALIAPFLLVGADPFTTMFPAVSGVTSLALVILMTMCSISAVVASRRGRLDGGVLATQVAPGLVAVLLMGIGAVIIAQYRELTGSPSPVIAAMPVVLVLGGLYGAWVQRRARTDLTRLDG